MRWAIGAVLALVMVPSLLIRPGAPAQATSSPSALRVMIVGDSTTQGAAGDWTWRYRLWEHLRATGTAVDFVGERTDVFDTITGRDGSHAYNDPHFDLDHNARWGATLTYPREPIDETVARNPPDVLVLALGINDVMWRELTPTEIADLAGAAVRAARLRVPGMNVVLVGAGHTWIPGVADFNAALRDQGVLLSTPQEQVRVAIPEALQRRQDTWDGIHLTASGEVKTAHAVADQLASLGVGAPFQSPDGDNNGPRQAPRLKAWSNAARGVTLQWGRAPGVDRVYVWRKNLTRGTQWRRGKRANTAFRHHFRTLRSGERYAFRVQPGRGWIRSSDVWSNTVTLRVA